MVSRFFSEVSTDTRPVMALGPIDGVTRCGPSAIARSSWRTSTWAEVAPPTPRLPRLASVGGGPAPRRPAARTTTFIGSPRSAGPQPRDALRLALPHRGFFEGSPVPGRVGEGDRADRRERDTGVTVGGDVRAPGGGVT